MTHEWRHPKFYAELRKQRRLQARKLTSSQASGLQAPNLEPRAQAQVPSAQAPGSKIQGTSEPSPCPGNRKQE